MAQSDFSLPMTFLFFVSPNFYCIIYVCLTYGERRESENLPVFFYLFLFCFCSPYILSLSPVLYFILEAWTYEWGITPGPFGPVFSWNVLDPVINHTL